MEGREKYGINRVCSSLRDNRHSLDFSLALVIM